RQSEAGGKRPRRSAVSRVARLALVRRENALQGVARRSEAYHIWKLLNRKKFSSKRKVKSKSIRAMLMDEDDEIDKDPSTFGSGKYSFHIDTVDQYDSDASLNDISVEEWDE
ncbi:unnamed protein product, partial [Prunus brigantina]